MLVTHMLVTGKPTTGKPTTRKPPTRKPARKELLALAARWRLAARIALVLGGLGSPVLAQQPAPPADRDGPAVGGTTDAATLAFYLRTLLEHDVGRWRFSVVVHGAAHPEVHGEWVQPRWKLQRHRLEEAVAPAGGLRVSRIVYERYTHIGAAGAPGKTVVLAREQADDEWLELPPETPLPERLTLPLVVLETLLVGAVNAEAAGIDLLRDPLPLDAFLVERIARVALVGRTRLDFAGSNGTAVVQAGGDELLLARCQLAGTSDGKPIRLDVELSYDSAAGLLPYDHVPLDAVARLGLIVQRPGEFRPAPRVLDRLARDRSIETEFTLGFSDRDGGLGAEGKLYQHAIEHAIWRDQEGRTVASHYLGITTLAGQGAELGWRFGDLERLGVERLDLDLALTANFYPIHAVVSYSRGGDVHAEEHAWMPRGLMTTEIGELPPGVREARRP